MWQVIARYRDVDYIIHDDRITDEECKILSPALTVEDNKSGTLEFTICPSNNGYNKIYPMLTECRVLKNGKIIWFGRVLTADSDFYKRLKIHCEGGLSYLCDFYYPAEALPNPNYKYAFPQAVDGIMYWYNETLTDSKFISYGLFRSFTGKTVAFDGKEVVGRYDDDFIKKAGSDNYRAWPYPERSSMTILDWLLASTAYYNGHLFVTRETASDGTWVQYLNFKSGYNTWTGQTIRFGENLLDYTKSIDGSNFHTAVRPYGNIEVTNGDQSETIDIDVRYILKKYFNDAEKQDFVVTNSATDPSQNFVMTLDKSRNIAYCHSFETNMPDVDGSMQTWADIYGIICKPFEANFVGSEFIGRLISHFRETKPESMVIEIRAVDMDLLGATSSDIEILDMIHVVSKPHNVDGYFPVTKIEYHLDDPSQTVYTIDTGAVESQSSVTGSSSVSVDTKITSSGYKHPTYKENSLGFYKFANDAIGSVTDAQPVTKKDITDLGIPESDTNTTYRVTQYPLVANGTFSDGPTVALEGTDGHYSHTNTSNTYTIAAVDALNSYNSGEEIIDSENGNKHRIILNLDIFVPGNFYEESAKWISYPIIIDSYITMTIKNVNKRFWARIYTFARCNLEDMPTRVIIRQLDPNSQYSDIDWMVYSGSVTNKVYGGMATRFQIGINSNAYSEITTFARPKVYTTNVTSAYGDTLGTLRHVMDINAIGVTAVDTMLELSSQNASDVAFTGDYNDLSNKPTIPDISGKQDKTTAVTHTANTAVGSATKPVYIAANGAATAISHSINADVPANAKFTDTTYNDATQSAHGLMTAADKKKLDGMDLWIAGANNAAKWYRLGTLVSSGNFSNAVIRIWSGDGANGRANQNASFEIQIKDGWQSTESATKACGVTVYRINCRSVKVKVIPTTHDTYTVWVYLPWLYWNGNYAVYGKYKSWTSQQLIQSNEPEGTGSDTAYYDQAFLTSTVAKANEATTLTETAWTDVPETNISPRYGKNIKYLKTGNTVYVRGSISFSASLNNPCCGTMPSDLLPDDYQDHVFTAWHLSSGVPTAYPVVLAKDGKITLMNPTSTSNWFVAGKAYNFNFNYHIN
nr:MAG TPA: endopeptidase tail [Caudoviricetes sp.]